MKFIVGTRGSKLSRIQTQHFLDELKRVYPKDEFELKIIKTLGDTEHSKPLFTIDSQGIFEKEIDQALVNEEVDFAVASLKDVPTVEIADTVVAAVPKRASPCDVLISKNNIHLKDLPKNAVIGTGSLRRLAQVKNLRPDIEVKPIRGNVDTRVQKVKKGEVDGIIVAEAGLQRMGLDAQITERFSLDLFPSAPGQGALAVVTRKNDEETIKFLRVIEHPQTRAEVTAERSLMKQLGGGCRVPIGAVGKAEAGSLSLRGVMFTLDGQNKIEASATGKIDEAELLGKQVAESLVQQGAKDIELKWREKYGAW
ncbi:MAG: hydroxymethylbilane synthase [Candidatus Bathyarchaeota archaeon]|nr:hydroxymethylbilane synthase [Candidatus Bathyarchaeota archaeon]